MSPDPSAARMPEGEPHSAAAAAPASGFSSPGEAMTATQLHRIAAVVLVVFAAGHTVGFIAFRPPSAEGLAVHQAMNSVQFEFDGAKHSYGAFYTGFGITVT